MTQNYVHLNSRQQPSITSTPTLDLTPDGPYPHYLIKKYQTSQALMSEISFVPQLDLLANTK